MSAPPPSLIVTQHRPEYWRVTFNAPPLNLITPELVAELRDVVFRVSTDPQLKVVVFDSANDQFFLSHFDLARAREFPVQPGPDGLPTWVDLVLLLSKAPVISIASIRGRTRGGGDEFALACDLRYASRERAIFGQPEVGTGILPGGGATERLPRLAGRDRALEVIVSSDDYDAATAERFGWITRALPDSELDDFVEALAARLSGFDKDALAAAKARINCAVLPDDSELRAAYAAYFASLSWPGFRARMPDLAKKSPRTASTWSSDSATTSAFTNFGSPRNWRQRRSAPRDARRRRARLLLAADFVEEPPRGDEYVVRERRAGLRDGARSSDGADHRRGDRQRPLTSLRRRAALGQRALDDVNELVEAVGEGDADVQRLPRDRTGGRRHRATSAEVIAMLAR